MNHRDSLLVEAKGTRIPWSHSPEPDRPLLRFRRRVHQLADRREDAGDRLVVSVQFALDTPLQLLQLAGQFLVRKRPAKSS